jgi:hypothetical protein
MKQSIPRTRPWLSRGSRVGMAVALTLLGVGQSEVSHATAPAGRYTVMSSTVLDNKTGLLWQRDVDTATQRTQDEAKTYCAGVSLPGSGWRVPSVKELSTLVDDSAQFPAWDTTAFPDTGFYYFTTSTPGNIQVFFALGTVTVDRSSMLVRCVR